MIERFREVVEDRHAYARAWKERTGRKVLGYFCTYVPEEVLYAAGVLPVRILGSHEPQDVTEPHIFGMYCPFCRDCLAQGLKGRYDYLEGLMIAQSCLHIRQAFTSWEKHRPVEFSYYLCMPNNVQNKAAAPFLAGELVEFKAAVEKWTGTTITDAALEDAIQVYDRSRTLLRRLYDMRKENPPRLTGLEALEIVLANQWMDKREHNELLEAFLAELPQRTPPREAQGTRLMIVGSEDDDRGFFQMAEGVGATFVVDDHCTGSRYFWNTVPAPNGKSPLERLARRYVDRPRCPSKDWMNRDRINHVLSLAKEWDVKGAVLMQQKFCDPHELDIPALKKALEAHDIKTQFLEFDVTVPIGQFRIRVEAFLETLAEEDLF